MNKSKNGPIGISLSIAGAVSLAFFLFFVSVLFMYIGEYGYELNADNLAKLLQKW